MTRDEFEASSNDDPVFSVSLGGSVFGIFGRVFMAVAVLLGVAGFSLYLAGNDVALLLLIAGFGAFVFAIGLLAAARSSR